LIEDLLPVRTGKQGRLFSDVRSMVEGISYRYRCDIAWRDVPEVLGAWQTIWTWHRRDGRMRGRSARRDHLDQGIVRSPSQH
jgi:transposase